MSNWWKRRPLTACESAASEAAQAASTVKLGPFRLKVLAMRPAITFESSPGIVSSLIVHKPALKLESTSAAIAARSLAASLAKARSEERRVGKEGRARRGRYAESTKRGLEW